MNPAPVSRKLFIDNQDCNSYSSYLQKDTFMRMLWDPQKSEWLKNHPKRRTSFEEAKIIFEDPSKEIGGELKSDEPEQYYTVGIAANGAIDIQIKILDCVIGRAISTTYKTYALLDGAPSSLARTII